MYVQFVYYNSRIICSPLLVVVCLHVLAFHIQYSNDLYVVT